MTDTKALIVRLNQAILPVLNSLAADCPSSEPADQIYFCLARLRVLMRSVVLMLESESADVRAAAQQMINDLVLFTDSVTTAESLVDEEE